MHLPTLPSHRNEVLRLLKTVCLGPGVVDRIGVLVVTRFRYLSMKVMGAAPHLPILVFLNHLPNQALQDNWLRQGIARAPLVSGHPAVLLHDLPTKTAHQILRSVTWTEVGSPHRATTALRGSIRRAARWAGGFRIYGALFTDILHGLINGRTLL